MKKFILLILFFSGSIIFCFAQAGQWTWMNGDSAFLYPGHYGTQGIADPANAPPAMYSPTRWKDLDGNFWFYGGYGPAEFLGDLWKFDPVQNEWTWVKGNKLVNQPAVYGTLGIPSPNNSPGCRGWSCSSWTDDNGDLWIFGGRGYGDDPTKATQLADLWRYHIATNEWTWMKGNGDDFVHYGTKQVSAVSNTPGKRQEITADWTDHSGGLWFYGGISNGVLKSDRNDMWRYDISTNLWTWMSGDTLLNVFPVQGTTGVFSPANTPGGRMSYCSWQDDDGMFWFFGGHNDFYGPDWCDLWKYDPAINQWAFISGSISNTDGNAGDACDTSHLFFPKGRWENRVRWIDACGNLWLFGGQRNSGSLNDLWVYSPKMNVWSYVNGSLITNNKGKYGTKGVSDPDNVPGSRTGAGSWIDNKGNMWLFAGSQTTSHETLRNDMWKYSPDPDCPAISCGKNSANDGAVYSLSTIYQAEWIHDLDKTTVSDDSSFTIVRELIRVYPNPSAGNFTIEFRNSEEHSEVSINILNTLGQIVFSAAEKIPSENWTKKIDLCEDAMHCVSATGVYLIQIKTGNEFYRKKIVVSK